MAENQKSIYSNLKKYYIYSFNFKIFRSAQEVLRIRDVYPGS
jgi:hypothetical protein